MGCWPSKREGVGVVGTRGDGGVSTRGVGQVSRKGVGVVRFDVIQNFRGPSFLNGAKSYFFSTANFFVGVFMHIREMATISCFHKQKILSMK